MDHRIHHALHQYRSHWILSPEGVVAIADTFGTVVLSGSITAIAASCLFVSSMSAANENTPNHNSEEINLFFIESGHRAITWANQRITRSLAKAKRSVFDRMPASNYVIFTHKNYGGTAMSSATTLQPSSVAVGQQLSNDEEPICPISLDTVPIDRRAIVISCSDQGKPSATIYDQKELFKWLNEKCFDPLTKKIVQCVVNSKGTIIYPVRIQSEVTKGNIVKATGPSVVRRIFSPGYGVISSKEIYDQRRLSNARYKEIEKKINNLKKN